MKGLKEGATLLHLGLLPWNVGGVNPRTLGSHQKCGFVFKEVPLADFAVAEKLPIEDLR
jgi:hypothetical protein